MNILSKIFNFFCKNNHILHRACLEMYTFKYVKYLNIL